MELQTAAPTRAADDGAGSLWPLSWRVHGHILGGAWNAFGLSRELLLYSIRRPIFSAVNRWMMALDHLFFPGFSQVPVTKPVFVIGHPRSGTTFSHRLLTQTREFCVFELWELLVPSLTLRSLVRPFVRRQIARGKATVLSKQTGHMSALDEVEEEEMLFYHTLNTQFIAHLSPLAFSQWDFHDLVIADEQPESVRRYNMQYFRGCLQRQLYQTRTDRVVGKAVYNALRIRSLLQEFPDAKFVYIVRSPLDTIPSNLSLERNVMDQQWNLSRVPVPLLMRYYQRRYRYSVLFYRYMEDVIESHTVPDDQLLVITYEALKDDLARSMDRIIEFTQLRCSPELKRLIDEQAAAQSQYERPHKNQPLEDFGLSSEQLVSDLGFIFDKYGFPRR